MRKRELELDIGYVVDGDPLTPHRLVALKAPDDPRQVATRIPSGAYYTIHPNRIRARWDDPAQVAAREREAARKAKHARAIDLAERLGFTVARDGDGWEAHRDAQARIMLSRAWVYRRGRDVLEGVLEIDLDTWLARAPVLAVALDVARQSDQTTIDQAAGR